MLIVLKNAFFQPQLFQSETVLELECNTNVLFKWTEDDKITIDFITDFLAEFADYSYKKNWGIFKKPFFLVSIVKNSTDRGLDFFILKIWISILITC